MVLRVEAMTPRPMREDDESAVRKLYAQAHPFWPPRPEHWFFAYPSLVLEQDGEIVGFTSFSLGSMTGVLMLHGQDLAVDLTVRGAGFGMSLHRARLEIGRAMGATMFSGFTQKDNEPMQRIFRACGHHACQTIRHYFPDRQDGVLYLGPLSE